MIQWVLNILWFVLGGLPMALGWWLAGILCALSIVGLPWSRACFVIGPFALWPFGYEAINRREQRGGFDLGTSPVGTLGNVIWFLVAGWWLAIGHLTSALACFISIIGIPFGVQHIKLSLIAIAPIGMTIVPIMKESWSKMIENQSAISKGPSRLKVDQRNRADYFNKLSIANKPNKMKNWGAKK